MVIIAYPSSWELGRSAEVSPPGLPRPVLRDPPFGGFPARLQSSRRHGPPPAFREGGTVFGATASWSPTTPRTCSAGSTAAGGSLVAREPGEHPWALRYPAKVLRRQGNAAPDHPAAVPTESPSMRRPDCQGRRGGNAVGDHTVRFASIRTLLGQVRRPRACWGPSGRVLPRKGTICHILDVIGRLTRGGREKRLWAC